ncbi:MAG: hypothetical protein J2P25_00315 [Nocardiopsaceae bacterium]|nr:hypothetical protein [Nocardiopsaceae bacterium]
MSTEAGDPDPDVDKALARAIRQLIAEVSQGQPVAEASQGQAARAS